YEIIEVDEILESWDLERFNKNPVLMWAHDYYCAPIGKAQEVTAGPGGKLSMRVVFDVDEDSEKIWRKYRDGFMKAFSVGFQRGEETVEQGAERPLIRLRNNELLELSAVPIPRDAGALVETAARQTVMSARQLARQYTSLNG